MYNVIVRPRAKRELREAYVDLEVIRDGLGKRFDAVVRVAFDQLQENPFRFPEVEPDVRRVLLTPFQYKLIFVVRKNRVRIEALYHTARDPDRWRDG